MRRQWTRRGFLGVTGAAGAATLLAAACSRETPAVDGAPGPVTVTHLFGETVVPEPPKRVVCAGYTGQDDLLALGVVPIAVTRWFGDQPFAVWPWARAKLGDAEPEVLDLDDGIDVKKIAALKPDLIVATNAGVDADTYRQLSAIAPTLPQTDGDAFFEPWKVQADAIGRAVHQAHQMQTLIDGVDAKFADAATAHPGFRDKRALLLHGRLDRGNATVSTGWRSTFLTQLGLSVPDIAAVIEHDRLRSALSAADVLIWTTGGDGERDALLADPDIAALRKRCVFTTAEQAGAIAFGSPLSYPVVAAELPGRIADVIG
ncbi:ABC transporter substrate-binding protein [Mycobacterium sp. M1]|uniref:ABC transporter substrate-binding protein n=1 Tax=Mycolicibacter acidiphilus TaxID=2835306 RepID=A0ABS5RGD5_9MYCO|nr:ABC transporter substrate-binding protein [Mycolicibacter acidiphilus]MBS9533347.1 ABC transporter substrate-binding protein [Mycolicibacter acidiphilus]